MNSRLRGGHGMVIVGGVLRGYMRRCSRVELLGRSVGRIMQCGWNALANEVMI
jgi:hypothetical protein